MSNFPDTSHLKTYRQAVEFQLSEWVEGRPWHNPFEPDNTRHDGDSRKGECCPDFSCCIPEMLADEKARKAFVDSKGEDRTRLLFGFLSQMTSTIDGPKIYVAGDPDVDKSGDLQ